MPHAHGPSFFAFIPVLEVFAWDTQPCVEALLPDLGRRYVISVRPTQGDLLVPPFVMVEFRVAFLDESEHLGTHPAELLIVDRAHPPLFAVCSCRPSALVGQNELIA